MEDQLASINPLGPANLSWRSTTGARSRYVFSETALALIARRADAAGRWTDSLGGLDVEFVCTTDPQTVHVASTSGGNIITRYAMWFAWHAMYTDDAPVQ